ncbi:hypothetical protein [Streptomyces sp. NPDC048106]|uniref:hypothetical protein n=1 Tax=Streptomyces sp. NPDC048106 TaxID=3155750 RepID=UPI003451188A
MSATVVLALTGFSSGHDHKSGGHSDDGGGCSNSRQDHDSSPTPRGSDSSDSATSSSDSGGGSHPSRTTHPSTPTAFPSHATAQPLKDGTAVLVHCASVADPYATVEVRNPNGREGLFTVKINFKDARGITLVDTGDQVSVPAKDKTTLRVPLISSGRVEEIAHCDVDPRAVADR